MKKGLYLKDGILIIVLLIALIFKNKFVVIAPNLDVSISIFIYTFTFLILGYILTKYNYKEAKNNIKTSIIIISLFLFLTTIINNIPGNNEINQSLINIFTPYNISILDQNIYIFDLSIILILLIYYLTHSIFISINDTLNTITNKYLSFGISIFIAFIIDTMFIVPTLYIKDIYYANLDAFDIIKSLTANFMVLIIMSLLSLLIYTLIFQKKKN